MGSFAWCLDVSSLFNARGGAYVPSGTFPTESVSPACALWASPRIVTAVTDEQPDSGSPQGGVEAPSDVAPCQWCGRPVTQPSSGRKRKYCKRSCRQRAYEQRQMNARLDLPEGTMVLTEAEATSIAERAFMLRCAAEDLHTAVQEGASTKEIGELAEELVRSAREAERIR